MIPNKSILLLAYLPLSLRHYHTVLPLTHLLRVSQEPLLLLLDGRAVADVDDGRGAVELDVYELVAPLVAWREGLGGGRLVDCDVDFSSEAVQLGHVLRSFPVVFLQEGNGCSGVRRGGVRESWLLREVKEDRGEE